MPRRVGPPRLSGRDKASSSRGSGLRGGRPAGRPAAPGSPAAGSLRTAERSVRPGSEKQKKKQRFEPLGGARGRLGWRWAHLEGAWSHVAAAAEPHLLHQVGVSLGDLAPHSQGVLPVDLRLVLVVEEVLGERRGVAQALAENSGLALNHYRGGGGFIETADFYLEGRVHETRVAQIAQPAQARLRLGLSVVVGGAVGAVASQPGGGGGGGQDAVTRSDSSRALKPSGGSQPGLTCSQRTCCCSACIRGCSSCLRW